jgi:putative hydrolase of the HAD superfamily
MTIELILWDIGGVLERTEDHAPRLALADRLGWEVSDLSRLFFGHSDQYSIQLGYISMEEHFAQLAQALARPVDQIPALWEAFFAGDRLDLGLVSAIRVLAQDHITGVISNYTPQLREKIENTWRIGDAFDHLVISSEVGVMKPDPEIYRIALETAGVAADRAVFLDDYLENVAGARQVGMHAIHFVTPEQALPELDALLGN